MGEAPADDVESAAKERWSLFTKAPWTRDIGAVQGRIHEAFALFDKDKKGVVIQEEVPTIIRYLGAYPSEKEIIRDLLPEMQPDEPVGFVAYEKFEVSMLTLLSDDDKYEPDDDDSLRQAFLALDKERNGYVSADTLSTLMTTKGTPFRQKEIEAFLQVAKDPDTGRIYYDDYIATLAEEAQEARAWRAQAATAIRASITPAAPAAPTAQ
eukprot:g3629.t1